MRFFALVFRLRSVVMVLAGIGVAVSRARITALNWSSGTFTVLTTAPLYSDLCLLRFWLLVFRVAAAWKQMSKDNSQGGSQKSVDNTED